MPFQLGTRARVHQVMTHGMRMETKSPYYWVWLIKPITQLHIDKQNIFQRSIGSIIGLVLFAER